MVPDPECNHTETRVQTLKHVERVGPYMVNDATDGARVCDACGDYTITDAQLERYELRAAVTVLLAVVHPDGAAIRYARKALGLKHAEFGPLLGVTAAHVPRWESGDEPVTIVHRMAMVGYLLGVLNGTVDLRRMLAQAQGTTPERRITSFAVVAPSTARGRRT